MNELDFIRRVDKMIDKMYGATLTYQDRCCPAHSHNHIYCPPLKKSDKGMQAVCDLCRELFSNPKNSHMCPCHSWDCFQDLYVHAKEVLKKCALKSR